MKYDFTTKLLGNIYHKLVSKQMKGRGIDKIKIKAVWNEFRATIDRAKDIGKSKIKGLSCLRLQLPL